MYIALVLRMYSPFHFLPDSHLSLLADGALARGKVWENIRRSIRRNFTGVLAGGPYICEEK